MRPTGLHSVQIDPRLPKTWDRASLRDIHAFGTVFDLAVTRDGRRLHVEVTRGGTVLMSQSIDERKTVAVDLR